MWSPKRRAVAAGLVLAGLLSGCGFTPLHRAAAPGARVPVEIAPIPDRGGQLLRNTLRQRLARASGPARYRLITRLNERRVNMLIRPDATSTLAKLTITARVTLRRKRDGAALLSPRARSVASFNLGPSEYANLVAERGARHRALNAIADDIHRQVAIFLRRLATTEDGA